MEACLKFAKTDLINLLLVAYLSNTIENDK